MLLKQKSLLHPLIACALFSFTFFLAGHMTYLTEGDAASYVHLYFEKIWTFLLPLASAYATLFICAKRKFGSIFLVSLFFALTSLVYYLPIKYEHYVLDERYVSLEALILALAFSLIMLVELYAKILSIALVILLFTRAFYKRERGEIFVRSAKTSVFDLDTARVGASLIGSVLSFLLSLIGEVVYTAQTLPQIINTITVPELITMIANYLLIVLLPVLSHVVLVRFSTLSKKNI